MNPSKGVFPEGGWGSETAFMRFYAGVSSAKAEELRAFRSRWPERSLHAGRHEWRYRLIAANKRGPVLLLLPGAEMVNDLGFEFAEAMREAEWTVLYPSYPRVIALDELAAGVAAVLDAEKIADCAVLGGSFGGAVAQVVVRRFPGRVRSLILSNTGVPMRNLVAAQLAALSIFKITPWPGICALLRSSLTKLLNPPAQDREFWRAYFDELLTARLAKADFLANIGQQLEYHRRFRFAPGDLADWSGRVLIAESDTDVIGPRRALRETYPQAEVCTYHDAGHAPMFSRPREYLDMVKRFLEQET